MRRVKMILVGGAMTVLAIAAMPALLSAQDSAAILKERQETMKQMGGHMKAINDFVEAGTGSAEDVATRAAGIREIAGKIPTLFPEGTSMDDGIGKTGAKPVIWSDWSGFQAAATKMGEEAGKLAEVAAAGERDAIGAQFAALGKDGCGGCHQTFRQKLD
jgi:cytochrome c556